MNYKNALMVHNIVEEMKNNDLYISILQEAIEKGHCGATMLIYRKDGMQDSIPFNEDKLNLLLQALYVKNKELNEALDDI